METEQTTTEAETEGRSAFVTIKNGQAHAMRHEVGDGSTTYSLSFSIGGGNVLVHLSDAEMLAVAEAITRVVRL